jgi:hypothetical protein
MGFARARRALTVLLAFGAISVVAPSQASAFISYYNCVNKPHNQWCDGRANGSYDGEHSWDYNEGWNPGGGSFTVCQRVWKPSSGGVLGGSSCSTNYAWAYYGDVQCVCYDAEVLQTSGSPKSINGFADAAW